MNDCKNSNNATTLFGLHEIFEFSSEHLLSAAVVFVRNVQFIYRLFFENCFSSVWVSECQSICDCVCVCVRVSTFVVCSTSCIYHLQCFLFVFVSLLLFSFSLCVSWSLFIIGCWLVLHVNILFFLSLLFIIMCSYGCTLIQFLGTFSIFHIVFFHSLFLLYSCDRQTFH